MYGGKHRVSACLECNADQGVQHQKLTENDTVMQVATLNNSPRSRIVIDAVAELWDAAAILTSPASG